MATSITNTVLDLSLKKSTKKSDGSSAGIRANKKVARTEVRATSVFSDEDQQWLKQSTAASGVSLKVRDPAIIAAVVRAVTTST
jgi:hypothetical protein